MTSRNVLVTGGAGYVGAHACKALAKAGYTPFVYDNLSTGHESFVRWGPLIKADIRDHATLREVLLSCDISAVLHFAACAYVGESVINPQKYYDNNVVGHAVAAAGDVGDRHLHHRVFEFLRHLRRAGAGSDHRSGSEAAS